jgi:hypothetical protein
MFYNVLISTLVPLSRLVSQAPPFWNLAALLLSFSFTPPG